MMVAVIGAGSWGTALSEVLASNGHDVRLWARKPEVVAGVNEQHRNPRYLVDVTLSERIVATTSFDELLEGAGAIVVVTPSRSAALYRRDDRASPRRGSAGAHLLQRRRGGDGHAARRGVSFGSRSATRTAVLSGPNHAEEVVRAQPSATVIASDDEPTAAFFRDLLASETFRTYTSDDPVGVELCAAFKNDRHRRRRVLRPGFRRQHRLSSHHARSRRDEPYDGRLRRSGADLHGACGRGRYGCDVHVAAFAQPPLRPGLRRNGKSLDDFEREFHMVVEGALACKTLACLADRTGVELPAHRHGALHRVGGRGRARGGEGPRVPSSEVGVLRYLAFSGCVCGYVPRSRVGVSHRLFPSLRKGAALSTKRGRNAFSTCLLALRRGDVRTRAARSSGAHRRRFP